MSIASEITRLQTAKADLKTAIENKGVTVPSVTTIDGYATLVDQILYPPVIEGSFIFSPSSASAQIITLGYSGNGFPIACMVVLANGVLDTTYTNTVAKNSIAHYNMYKTYPDVLPTYSTSGTENYGSVTTVYKSSNSTAATLTRINTTTSNTYSSNDGSQSTTGPLRFKSKTTMSVYIGSKTGTTRIGFMNGLEYHYWVMYSS